MLCKVLYVFQIECTQIEKKLQCLVKDQIKPKTAIGAPYILPKNEQMNSFISFLGESTACQSAYAFI